MQLFLATTLNWQNPIKLIQCHCNNSTQLDCQAGWGLFEVFGKKKGLRLIRARTHIRAFWDNCVLASTSRKTFEWIFRWKFVVRELFLVFGKSLKSEPRHFGDQDHRVGSFDILDTSPKAILDSQAEWSGGLVGSSTSRGWKSLKRQE